MYLMSSQVVECYSGQTYAERPSAIHWEGERLEISEILSRWRTPEHRHFLVRIDQTKLFKLTYNENDDIWTIELR
jgi:hypothetical protein